MIFLGLQEVVGSDDDVDGNSVNGRTVLAVVASRGCVAIHFLAYRFSFPSPSLWQDGST